LGLLVLGDEAMSRSASNRSGGKSAGIGERREERGGGGRRPSMAGGDGGCCC
jgi:hypothetical protein